MTYWNGHEPNQFSLWSDIDCQNICNSPERRNRKASGSQVRILTIPKPSVSGFKKTKLSLGGRDGITRFPLSITVALDSQEHLRAHIYRRGRIVRSSVCYAALWCIMSSRSKRCSWLAWHVSGEANVSFPFLRLVAWQRSAGWWEGIGQDQK